MSAMKVLATALLLANAADAQPVIQSVVNAGTLDARFCAGVLVNISGAGFGQQATEVNIMVGGKQAAVIGSVLLSTMSAQLPVDLPLGATKMTVTVSGQTSAPFDLTIDDFAPGFFSVGGHIFYNADGSAVTSDQPAAPGKQVTAYLVGLGATNPVVPTGTAPTTPIPTVVTPQLSVAGKGASVSSSALAAGKVGVYQVTFTVPAGTPSGNQFVVLTIGGSIRATPAVMMAVGSGAPLAPSVSAVENGATFQVKDAAHGAAPNSFISIFAFNLGTQDSTGNLFPATSFNGVSVAFNGTPAPLYNVLSSLNQINLVVPSEISETSTATITVSNSVGPSQGFQLTMSPVDVGIFRLTDPSNKNRKNGAVLFANTAWRVMPASMAAAIGFPPCTGLPAASTCGQPAKPGDAIQIYLTGAGKATPDGDPFKPPLATGTIAPVDGSVLYRTLTAPSVTIGAINAPVQFSGIAPGNAGLYQINVAIPTGVPPGDDVELVVKVGNTADTVTIAVQAP